LIDVLLCLLIFFVVTTTFDARSVLKLELPRADGQPAEAQSKALSLLVNAQGRYFVGDREALRSDLESLKATLREVAGDDRERTVLLRADARTPHQAVVTALDALGQLGFRRVAIATAPEPATATARTPTQ
jgi:biopolymer transport protein ExbD